MLDVLAPLPDGGPPGLPGLPLRAQHSGVTHGCGRVARNYLERPEYLLEWSRYFAEKGNYLAEGL